MSWYFSTYWSAVIQIVWSSLDIWGMIWTICMLSISLLSLTWPCRWARPYATSCLHVHGIRRTFRYRFEVLHTIVKSLKSVRYTVDVIWLQIISWAAKSGIPVILWYIYIWRLPSSPIFLCTHNKVLLQSNLRCLGTGLEIIYGRCQSESYKWVVINNFTTIEWFNSCYLNLLPQEPL